jgi:kinesin family protein 5
MELELKDLQTLNARLLSESESTAAALDAARDREFELTNDLGLAKRHVEALEESLRAAVADDREKKKADMLADMMAKIDTVSPPASPLFGANLRRTRSFPRPPLPPDSAN